MDVIAEPGGVGGVGGGGGAAPPPPSPSSSSSLDLLIGTEENAPDIGGGGGGVNDKNRHQRQVKEQPDDRGRSVSSSIQAPTASRMPSSITNSASESDPSSSLPSEKNALTVGRNSSEPTNPDIDDDAFDDSGAAAPAITPPSSSSTPRDDEDNDDHDDDDDDDHDDPPTKPTGESTDDTDDDGLPLNSHAGPTDRRPQGVAAPMEQLLPAKAPAAEEKLDDEDAPDDETAWLSRKEWMALRQAAGRGDAGGGGAGDGVPPTASGRSGVGGGGTGAGAAAAPSSASSATATLALKKPPPPAQPQPRAVEIIDLLDSESEEDDDSEESEDEDEDDDADNPQLLPRKHQVPAANGDFQPPPYDSQKKPRVDTQFAHGHHPSHFNSAPYPSMPLPLPRPHHPPGAILHPPPHGGAMPGMPPPRPDAPLLSAPAIPGPLPYQPHVAPMPPPPQHRHRLPSHGVPEYVPYPPGFRPTWAALMPDLRPQPPPAVAGPPRRKRYKLSLLNVNQFTITGLPPEYNEPPTSIAGLRVPIRQIARDHGKAVFDQEPSVDGDSGSSTGPGRWRIPLGAYHAFYAYLVSDPNTRVEGIPPHQLQIASLERARQEKGYPTVDGLAERGVPTRLSKALAPFQRGGVDFVIEKGGRALIADDMGLGKTIQGIASVAVYKDEWPVLVLCPSSARYHWESEFLRWLGAEDDAEDESTDPNAATHETQGGCTLASWQINVLTNSKSELFPYSETKIVVCTYGLALSLVQAGKMQPGMFGCAIVDESHMLKNKSSKRSKALVPLLRATPRCVLLSGTPALARPAELWPQLDVLGVAGRNGFWEDETDFMNKYVKRGGMTEKAELHTMLTGTIMIRRLKHDILKDLPRKVRSQALVHILTADQCTEFKGLLAKLRKSKGTLGAFARSHHASLGENSEEPASDAQSHRRADAEAALRAELSRRLQDGRQRILSSIENVALSPEARTSLLHHLEGELRYDLDKMYAERSASLDAQLGKLPGIQQDQDPDDTNRTTLLSHMYGLTGDCKIPLIVDMLQRWLADPTKGKLCIFAHHLSVLNAIRDKAGLSNDKHSRRKFIRIDGATMPKQRQELIKKFQTDPSVRIALLGITAAGVAVTLTASSTVWFAELFWTPALMIQAEDRCHRIGQQARVNCLYFVARGTLDEILWKLIEKKFQDLGEFVEGKEKLKLVVENVYESEKELHGMFATADDAEDDDAEFGLDETGIGNEISFDDFADDIALLGQEECAMLQFDSDDDDEGESAVPKADRKAAAAPVADGQASGGQSEHDAIVLIDDDEDDEEEGGESSATSGHAVAASAAEEGSAAASIPSQDRVVSRIIPDCRLYNLRVVSPSLGVELALYHGRPVVVRITGTRLEREGSAGSGKPALGDILVGVNGWPLPLVPRIEDIVRYVRSALARVPMELTCAECPSLRDRMLAAREAALLEEERLRNMAPKAGPDGVIEIDDDEE